MSSRYVCVECEEKAELLYSNFPGSNNIRIEHCPSCGQPVDSYVEYDVSLILLDMMLLVRPVWRHVLFNHDTARLHLKLAVVCLFCDGYMKWVTASREDEALRALNSTDIVFQAAMQIQLYVFTFVSALELAAFLLLTVALYWFVRPLIRKSASNVDAIVRCLLLASTGKVLYIPAIIWLQAGSAIYLQIILVYVVLCGALALSLTVKCSYMQALMVIILAFFWSALIMKPVGEWLYQLDLHLLTVCGLVIFEIYTLLDKQASFAEVEKRLPKLEIQTEFQYMQMLIEYRNKQESESVTKTTFVVSSLIPKRMKPFIDAEFVKECTLAIVNKVYPEKKVLFDSIPLSARTVTCKVEDISEHLKLQLKNQS